MRGLRARYRYVLEIHAAARLRRGDVITITWGERHWGSPGVRAPAIGMHYYFLPSLHSD